MHPFKKVLHRFVSVCNFVHSFPDGAYGLTVVGKFSHLEMHSNVIRNAKLGKRHIPLFCFFLQIILNVFPYGYRCEGQK